MCFARLDFLISFLPQLLHRAEQDRAAVWRGEASCEVVSSGEGLVTGFTNEGWGQVHGSVLEEHLLAGERLVICGTRHWLLMHLDMVAV